VLEVLYHKGPMALCSIGEKLLVTSGNITYVADQLEKAGLLKRQRSREDRRVIVARVTARGEALLDRHFPSHAECMRGAAQLLSPKERDELARLLKRWGKAVQSATAAAG
jgi:MarR family 2-MHQ and catechol resistance regulon transcriptional repressor